MKRKEILFIAIGIFLTVVASIVADIYHISVGKKIAEGEQMPVLKNYKIDDSLLEILERKQK